MILPKKFFQNIKKKTGFNNLDDSKVLSYDFPVLRTSVASLTSTASMASMTSTASFHQKFTDPDGLIIPGSKMTNTGPSLWNESSEIQFFTDISTFSVEGC